MNDYITDQGNLEMKSFVLVGGVKGWATAEAEYTELIDVYDEQAWK
jgi:arsenical-resistance protein 2